MLVSCNFLSPWLANERALFRPIPQAGLHLHDASRSGGCVYLRFYFPFDKFEVLFHDTHITYTCVPVPVQYTPCVDLSYTCGSSKNIKYKMFPRRLVLQSM